MFIIYFCVNNWKTFNGVTHSVMMEVFVVCFLNEVVFISHSTNTLGKGMNPIIFPPAMGE